MPLRRSSTSRQLLTGALGGLVGTAAMTAAMRRMHGHLPEAERYPLPPREIIQSMARETEADHRAGEGELQDLTLGAHFAYGAATGALYAALRPGGGIAAGAGYGLLVWAASYRLDSRARDPRTGDPPPSPPQWPDARGARRLGRDHRPHDP